MSTPESHSFANSGEAHPVERLRTFNVRRAEGLLRAASLLLARGEVGEAVRALHAELSEELGHGRAGAAYDDRRAAEERHRWLGLKLSQRRAQTRPRSAWQLLVQRYPQYLAWLIVCGVSLGLVLRYAYARYDRWRWARQHPEGAWISRYYGEHNLRDFQVLRYDVAIDYEWGKGAPAEAMDRDHWSASWDTCVVVISEVKLRLNLVVDESGKVIIDNTQLLRRSRPGSKAAPVTLTPGVHHLRVEYDERRRGARIHLQGIDFAGTDSYQFQRPRLIEDKVICDQLPAEAAAAPAWKGM